MSDPVEGAHPRAEAKARDSASPIEECLLCRADLRTSEVFQQYRVCPQCDFHYSLPARQRLDQLLDAKSFKETHRWLASLDPISFSMGGSYRESLFKAQRRTGLTEAILTGSGRIDGKRVIIAVLDFGFMGGSMGCVVGERIALSFEQAARLKLPIVIVVASGGARMQEGVLALMQMAKTAAAAQQFHEKGLPYIAVLANPTTGQVYSSFANLADFVLAEPGALMGFAPLRTVREASPEPLPQQAHTAEAHLGMGMVDAIVPRAQLRKRLSSILNLVADANRTSLPKKVKLFKQAKVARVPAWQAVQTARHHDRPTSLDYIHRIVSDFIELRGDRIYGDDPALVCGMGYLRDQPVMVIGHERGHGDLSAYRRDGRAYPEGYRKAQRAMRLAAKLRLPVITFVDTPGAHPGIDSEQRGIGSAIAQTLALMSSLPVPSVCAVIGEGGSEGALALSVADRILMMERAIYAPISPEAAAAILLRDARRAAEVAPSLKLTAYDCLELGVIDAVVPEPQGGAHQDPEVAAKALEAQLVQELKLLQPMPVKALLKERYEKYRKMGEYTSYFHATIAREVDSLQEFVKSWFPGLFGKGSEEEARETRGKKG